MAALKIKQLAEAELTRAEDEAIAALLAEAFGAAADYGGRSFYRQRPHVRFLGLREGVLTSHIALSLREVRLGARHVPILGVGEVATHPAHRGRGDASALLGAAIRAAATTPAKALMLFGNRPLYAAQGFRTVGNEVRYLGITDMAATGLETRCFDCLMIRPVRGFVWQDDAPLDLLGPLF